MRRNNLFSFLLGGVLGNLLYFALAKLWFPAAYCLLLVILGIIAWIRDHLELKEAIRQECYEREAVANISLCDDCEKQFREVCERITTRRFLEKCDLSERK